MVMMSMIFIYCSSAHAAYLLYKLYTKYRKKNRKIDRRGR